MWSLRELKPSLVACLLLAAPALQASEAGDWVVQGGWFYLSPQESSKPLQTELAPSLIGNALGIDQQFTAAGTSLSVNDSDTPALTLSYFLTDHIAIKLEGGVPADFELSGQGVVRPTGPAGALVSVDLGAPEHKPLASVRQWSPAILAQYYFRDPSDQIRPYLGLGLTYTWFDNIEANQDFEQSLNNDFGAVLALATANPGPTSVDAEAESDIAPIFNAGVAMQLNERWGLSLSVSYLMLETTSKITIRANDGSRLSESSSKLELNTVVSSFLVSYRWGGD